MSGWTEGDTRAEIARVVERAKEVLPPLEAAGKAIRQIGTTHGHEKLAEDGIERLREGVRATGIIVPNRAEENELRRALAAGRKGRIDELERQLVARHIAGPRGMVVGASVKPANTIPEGTPEWWDRLHEFASTAAAGQIIAFDRQVVWAGSEIMMLASPWTTCEPEFLVLDPRLPEGDVTCFEIGHMPQISGPTRISAFQLRGVAPEVFFANRLQRTKITPAHRATLILRFDEPYSGPVCAFMWARCHGDARGQFGG